MNKYIATSLFSFIAIFAISTPTQAAEFNPNLILSDYEFRDYESMTLDDVQRFLVDKGSYLAQYVDPYIRVRASQLIFDNSQLAQINPKVLLVKLQKEQSLITDSSPSQDQLDWATGYGICDSCSKSAAGVQKYRGLANQLDYAASSLRLFYDNPQTYGYTVGNTYSIDDQRVTIGNPTTHALYLYTPHIHGNKNFHTIWNDWFSQDFPDGSLLQDSETGGIYLLQHGLKRPFSSMAAFASRYNLNKVLVTSPENLDAYPLGPSIKYAQYSLLQDNTTGGIYLIVDDEKRPISSKEAFRKIGFNPEEVVPVSPADLAEVKTGTPITIKDAYPTGGLLQDKTTGGVWYVRDGIRQAIWSRELLTANYPNKAITPVTPEEINSFEIGEPVTFADGELVKEFGSPTVYVIEHGLKRPIPSEDVFLKLGYKWSNIIEASPKALSLHTKGEPLSIEG